MKNERRPQYILPLELVCQAIAFTVRRARRHHSRRSDPFGGTSRVVLAVDLALAVRQTDTGDTALLLFLRRYRGGISIAIEVY